MDDILVIGAGPAGLLAAWIAHKQGAKVRVLASGIGTTHISPGWIGVLNREGRTQADESAHSPDRWPAQWIADHPQHPYALAGLDALSDGLAALREIGEAAGLHYVGDLSANYRLPTALGAVIEAAVVPETFAAGDLRRPGRVLIAGPAGWRDFYPRLSADNLARQGFEAQCATFDLSGIMGDKFDPTAVALARLFDRPQVRAQVAAQLKPRLDGAERVGMPAALGLEHNAEAWHDLQDRLEVPVFEIPTLPPSVPGMRLFDAFKQALARAGVQILLDMTVTRGIVEDDRVTGVIVPGAARERTYRAEHFVLATGGLYGGGIASNRRRELRETVFGLPVAVPSFDAAQAGEGLGEWFNDSFLSARPHPIHTAGLRVNGEMQPVSADGRVLLRNVRVAGRLLMGYDPLAEGSTEGVWLATAYRAAHAACHPSIP